MFHDPGRHVPAVPRHERGQRALRHAALGGAHVIAWRCSAPARSPASCVSTRASWCASRVITVLLTARDLGGTRAGRRRLRRGSPTTATRCSPACRRCAIAARAQVFRRAAPPLPPSTGSVLDRVRARRMLRVGYFDDSLPYVFTNERGRAGRLRRRDGAAARARPRRRARARARRSPALFDDGLDPSVCDLVMSGAVVTADRALRVRFSTPYLDETVAFIVADHRRAEFATWDEVSRRRPLRLGVPSSELLPRADSGARCRRATIVAVR